MKKRTSNPQAPPPNDTSSSFPCSICGGSYVPDRLSRCERCGAFCCRDCLKIHYHQLDETSFLPTRILCYHCFHANEGNK